MNIVIENQPGLGVVSDIDGNYKIKADKYATLVASFIGYKTQRIAIAGKGKRDIVPEEEVEQLDEVSVVAAGVQRKATVVGAITTVDVEKLKTSGGSQLSNTLAGNVAGIIAMQRSGEPGANYSEFWIRGISTFGANSSALVLVDGIERDFNELNAEDIESFSVLKDASACYLRSAGGERCGFGDYETG
ncbi:MAG: TonB-dependent receptor plug domain-containing protein [Odoribacter splanchnicus]